MIVTEETKAVAQGVVDYIKANPEKHDQTEWIRSPKGTWGVVLTEDNFCGTTMCAAGATVFVVEGIDALNEPLYTFEVKAADYLGLDREEASTLFYNMSDRHALLKLEAIAAGDEERFNSIGCYDEKPIEVDSDV